MKYELLLLSDLLHVDSVQRWGLHVAHPEGPSQLFSLLPGDLPQSLQVTLVADQQKHKGVKQDFELSPTSCGRFGRKEGWFGTSKSKRPPYARVIDLSRCTERPRRTDGRTERPTSLPLFYSAKMNRGITTWTSPDPQCPRSEVWSFWPAQSPPDGRKSPPPQWDQTPRRIDPRWTCGSGTICQMWSLRQHWYGHIVSMTPHRSSLWKNKTSSTV